MIIPFILEKAVSLYADKEAVVSDGQRFTYQQFADRAYGLANALRSMGIGKGDRVAIMRQNSHEYLESYFAVAQIGAILNLLNFRLSPEELALILKDSGACLLITDRRFTEPVKSLMKLETDLTRIIWTGKGESLTLAESVDYEDIIRAGTGSPPPMPLISDDDVAHLYYTSGTTGRPKGVMLSHRNVCTHALAAIAEFRLGDHDNWIHAAPLFHLADAWATFAITWVGGKHVVVPDFDPPRVLSSMQQEKVTITNMIPTMLNMLVNTPHVESYDFSHVRTILSGGAPIAPELVKKIIETFRCEYIQTYGMTETSPYLTVSILKERLSRLPTEEQFVYRVKTGRPFLGVLLKVVREDRTEITADNNEVGEIIVKGDIVTKGYWNQPQETAQTIKEGWLYTGDMAVVDGEGYVNIVDRKKDMIITGGENVYSVEVENVLYSHPSLLEAAVIGVPDPKWGEAVKAIVALRPGHKATEDEIISHCKQHIAGYKAPKSVDFVSELPKTGSGKIYKKGLKERYCPDPKKS
ncbi:MAG: long-chain-fatty-acid--CoA ligase [Deltaproteobacteria bacterium]|nr:long-chain-fatty-acid--CoA ligase [Deltaproteobacteria bacterium]